MTNEYIVIEHNHPPTEYELNEKFKQGYELVQIIPVVKKIEPDYYKLVDARKLECVYTYNTYFRNIHNNGLTLR